MLRGNPIVAATGLTFILVACSDDESPTTGPRAGRASPVGVPALATTGSHSQVKGLTAQASFIEVDQSGCVETGVFVFASQQTGKGTDSLESAAAAASSPVTGIQIFVTASQFDFCTGQFLRSLSGVTTEGTFQVDRVKLSEAHVDATLLAFDDFTQSEVPMEVDLSWTATGEPLSLSSRFRQKQPGLLVTFSFKGTLRDAAAAGTVLVGGENLTPSVTDEAEISRSRNGRLEILKTHE